MAERTVLVTGASRGIGRAIAVAFGRDGASIVAVSRKRESLESVADEMAAGGVELTALSADLADEMPSGELCRQVVAEHRVDVLVNNAGIAESAKLADTDDALWARHLEINLTAAFRLVARPHPGHARAGVRPHH